MFCKYCGVENPEGASFCKVCGSALTAAPEIEASAQPVDDTPVEPFVETPVEPSAAPATEGETAPKITAKDPGKGLGIAALVLGIVGLVFGSFCSCCCCALIADPFIPGCVALVCGIVGLILGIIAMKKSKTAGFKNTSARVGAILSGIAIVPGVLAIIVGLFTFFTSFIPAFWEGFEQGYNGTYYGY